MNTIFNSILLVVGITFFSCTSKTNQKKTKLQPSTIEYVIPNDSSIMYFPLDSLRFVPDAKRVDSDSFIKSMYSQILYHLREPILYNYKGVNEIFRFLWIRPFDNPVTVKLATQDDKIFVNVKELKKEFYSNEIFKYQILIDTSIIYDSSQFKDLFKVNRDNFFSLDSYDIGLNNAPMHFSNWVLESNSKGRYHCVNRVYIDSISLLMYPIASEMYKIGSHFTQMKTSR